MMVQKLGLARSIDDRLQLLKVHLPYRNLIATEAAGWDPVCRLAESVYDSLRAEAELRAL